MTYYRTLRTYRFIDKDPVCDKVTTLIEDEGLIKRLRVVAELAGLNFATVYNLVRGDTRSPQNRTVMAIVSSLGYEHSFTKARKLNADEELVFARAWNEKEMKKVNAARAANKKATKHVKRKSPAKRRHRKTA